MSRSLPLSAAPTGVDRASTTEPRATVEPGAVAVYDPPMCCPTGVCGPGVDPALLQFTRDLRWLTAQGVTVERFGLSQEPQAFVASARVAGLMQAFGDAALPAVLVNGTVLAHGRYPSRDEVVAALATGAQPIGTQAAGMPTASLARRSMAVVEDPSSCEPGSGCC